MNKADKTVLEYLSRAVEISKEFKHVNQSGFFDIAQMIQIQEDLDRQEERRLKNDAEHKKYLKRMEEDNRIMMAQFTRDMKVN